MQDDRDADSPRTARRRSTDADVSAWTGLGLILTIGSFVVSRFSQGGVGATVVGFVALLPFGVAVVIAIRRRQVRALLLPLVMFVLTAILGVLRLT